MSELYKLSARRLDGSKQPMKDYKGKVTFAKLDTDQSPKTAMALGIRSIPTLIFYRSGEQVERVSGVRPRDDIENTLKKHFR